MDWSTEMELSGVPGDMVDDLRVDMAFGSMVRTMMFDGGRVVTARAISRRTLWLLRVVALAATLGGIVVAIALFGVHLILGIATLFFLPVFVLGAVLATEAVASRVA